LVKKMREKILVIEIKRNLDKQPLFFELGTATLSILNFLFSSSIVMFSIFFEFLHNIPPIIEPFQ